MKRFLFSILFLFVCSFSAIAQLRPPVQADTLIVTAVQYNYSDIRPENWPCQCIVKTTTYFSIAGQRFDILEVSKLSSVVLFTVSDGNGRADLKYREEYNSNNISIKFSGYEFTCRPKTQKDKIQIIKNEDSGDVSSNVGEQIEEEAISFQSVDVKPSFQGGNVNVFSKWVGKNLEYPKIAKENGVQGRVTTQFTVETDGRITNVKVLRGIDPFLDMEAVRVVSSSPRWKPGEQKGRPVRVTYAFPVIFQLR